MSTTSENSVAISGPELLEMFAAATSWLEREVESLNAINVFPGPDGDTGRAPVVTSAPGGDGRGSRAAHHPGTADGAEAS